MIKKLKCIIFGHVIDWEEYQDRIESEDIFADARHIYCEFCRSYFKVDIKKYLHKIKGD